TIPSLALFGLFMLPLGYLATHVPLAAAIGILGIGTAPALIALVLYSLLPIVANTVVGLHQHDADAGEDDGKGKRHVDAGQDLPACQPHA
ncbi:ABC transporter permease, partial [Rhizobium ruizarguesonis]